MNREELFELIEKEGMRKEFIYKGYDCLIRRTPMQILCGYVKLPKGHKYFRKEDEEIPVEVHGGITWTGEFKDGQGYYIGFDCAHCFDLIPYTLTHYPNWIREEGNTYKTMEYVEKEIKSMIDQMEE